MKNSMPLSYYDSSDVWIFELEHNVTCTLLFSDNKCEYANAPLEWLKGKPKEFCFNLPRLISAVKDPDIFSFLTFKGV